MSVLIIDKEFVPPQEALDLKELGFDEPCFGFYHNDKTFYNAQCKSHEQFYEQLCSAPTFSQAFRWFREKYGVHSSPRKYDETNWWVEWGTWTSPVFETFEEAELAWLRKLIEIVKQKSLTEEVINHVNQSIRK